MKNGEFKIEKRVPLPSPRKHGGESKYPFRDMEVGDSFIVKGSDGNSIRSTASNAGRRLGRKFTVANEEDGHRIWRIK